MDNGFAAKLDLVLKALSISRGRLAADLGVDKSLVSRWASGVNQPSGENLSQLTRLVSERHPGFTMLDWDHDLDALAETFGADRQRPAVAAPADVLAIALTPAIAAASRARASAYAGIWRLTFSAGINEQPDMFVHSYSLVRQNEAGLLAYKVGIFDVVLEGWMTAAGNQLFAVAMNPVRGTVMLGIFNGVADEKALFIDGISLSCRDGLGGTPVVAACVSERVLDLTGDCDADDASFAALLTRHPVAPPGSISPAVRDRLLSDVGPAAAAAGGDLLMIMPHLRSMARGTDAATAPRKPMLRAV